MKKKTQGQENKRKMKTDQWNRKEKGTKKKKKIHEDMK